MAVFWFGWAKKLKNVFTKKEADTLYLQKNSNQLQQVSGFVDFTSNVVCKRNGYVDNVDTNAPTSMINKRYLEEQTLSKTSTSAQTVAGPVSLHSPIELGTEIKAGYGGSTVKFIPEDNSTKTLQFYNANATDQRRFNLLIPNPTAAQNPATKQYVDNKTTIEAIFTSGTTIKYQNLAKINENIFDDTNRYDFTKPIYVSFTRYNNNVNLGCWTGTLMYNQDNTYWLIATNIYRSNSTQNMEIGQYAGLLITRSFIQIQCWDTNERIGNIIMKAHLS